MQKLTDLCIFEKGKKYPESFAKIFFFLFCKTKEKYFLRKKRKKSRTCDPEPCLVLISISLHFYWQSSQMNLYRYSANNIANCIRCEDWQLLFSFELLVSKGTITSINILYQRKLAVLRKKNLTMDEPSVKSQGHLGKFFKTKISNSLSSTTTLVERLELRLKLWFYKRDKFYATDSASPRIQTHAPRIPGFQAAN